jgi:hypothetical protein
MCPCGQGARPNGAPQTDRVSQTGPWGPISIPNLGWKRSHSDSIRARVHACVVLSIPPVNSTHTTPLPPNQPLTLCRDVLPAMFLTIAGATRFGCCLLKAILMPALFECICRHRRSSFPLSIYVVVPWLFLYLHRYLSSCKRQRWLAFVVVFPDANTTQLSWLRCTDKLLWWWPSQKFSLPNSRYKVCLYFGAICTDIDNYLVTICITIVL